MLKKYISYYSYRSFSKSTIWRNLEKSKPSEIDPLSPSSPPSPSPPSPSPPSINIGHGLLDFTPTKSQRRILVLSGRFKSEKDIPSKISFETFGNAKSRLRIRISNLLIVLTICLFGYSIWFGKKKRSDGDSILKRMLQKDREILEAAKMEKNVKS